MSEEVIDEMKEFARGNTLGEGLTIRDMIEEGRGYRPTGGSNDERRPE